MEQQPPNNFLATTRYAVVTGGNKGIGLEICKQLASKGIKVVLTARDEKRGFDAFNKLKQENSDLSQHLVFHQLDVTDFDSIASLAEFVKTQFGKLDILINNAGISGIIFDADALVKAVDHFGVDWPYKATNKKDIMSENYEMAKECINTNYYGAKATTEALLPLLQLSDSPRLVNVSSRLGSLSYIPNEWAKEVLSNLDKLTEERIDEVINEFLKDFEEGKLEAKGWPTQTSAYTIAKASMNGYTRIMAKRYPNMCVNCVCPGFVRTDMTCNTGNLSPKEGAENPVRLALLPNNDQSGLFFSGQQVLPF